MKILPSSIRDNIFSVNDDSCLSLKKIFFWIFLFWIWFWKFSCCFLFIFHLSVFLHAGVLINRKKRAEKRTLVYSAELTDSHCCSDQFHFTHHYVSINIVSLCPQINARLFFFVFFSSVIFTPFDSSSLSSTETVNVLTSMCPIVIVLFT